MKYLDLPIAKLSEEVRSGRIKAADVAEESLSRIKSLNPKINAFVYVNERAIDRARQIDADVSKGVPVGPLAGIPVGIKDLLCTEGMPTTACSNILKDFVPPYTATVVKRLEDAGAVVMGKLNCDEFAMGSSNENSCFGVVQNPWKEGFVAGGSSGGSAAAVAARMVCASIGTDTGGSIRQPASFCGISGIKPTYGRVSRYGIIAFASSLDQAGPMANRVEDAAEVLRAIAGHDPHDATTAQRAVPEWRQELGQGIKGFRVGLPKEYFSDAVHPEVRAAVERAIEVVKQAGATVVDVSLPHTEYCVSTYYLVAASEASSNLARYDGIRYGLRVPARELDELYKKTRGQGFGKEVKRRIMIGTYALSSGYYDAYYKKACQVRALIQKDFLTAFEKCDVMLSPVTTSPAFQIGARIDKPLEMYLNDIFTTSTNLAGLPGMSVHAGLTKEGLPIGVQLTAAHFEESKIFRVAQMIENSVDASARRPHGLQ